MGRNENGTCLEGECVNQCNDVAQIHGVGGGMDAW